MTGDAVESTAVSADAPAHMSPSFHVLQAAAAHSVAVHGTDDSHAEGLQAAAGAIRDRVQPPATATKPRARRTRR